MGTYLVYVFVLGTVFKGIDVFLKSNVLVNDQRKACLCDFGLASVVGEFMDTTNSSVLGGAVRWAAPEVYDIPDQNDSCVVGPTMSSDIYSFGSLALEVN